MLNLMKKFTSVHSVSGCEYNIAKLIEEELAPYADSITTDNMGNLIVFKKGADSSKKVMTAAHMDEIGFIVTFIEDSGFVRVSQIGGIRAFYSAYHKVRFENGTIGAIIAEPNAEIQNIKPSDLYIDIGAKDKKDAMRKVNVGDTCAVVPSLARLLNNRYTAKAFDNRIGCAVAVYAAKKAKAPKYDTYYVFTVQEEVGLRGAKPAAFAIAPTYAIAVDVTGTGDIPGATPMAVKLGNGAAIKVKDSSVICSKKVIDALVKTAKDAKIKYQLEILDGGGTDTASLQTIGAGAYVGCISIPTRYIHSPVETLDLADVIASGDLLAAYIENVE